MIEVRFIESQLQFLEDEGRISINKLGMQKIALWDGLIYKGGFKGGFGSGKHMVTLGDDTIMSFYTENNLLHGELKSYGSKRKLMTSFYFKEGLREGGAKLYYDSGQVFQALNFSDGYFDGKQMCFYKNGSPMLIYHFASKKLNGLFSYHKEEGGIYYHGSMKNGLKIGKWDYSVSISSFLVSILRRNESFFDQNFNNSGAWKLEDISKKEMSIKVDYSYYRSKDCLNNTCLKLIFLPL